MILTKEQVNEYHRILDAGLSRGLGERGNPICIEAAICQTLGLPHGDDPGCVIEILIEMKSPGCELL